MGAAGTGWLLASCRLNLVLAAARAGAAAVGGVEAGVAGAAVDFTDSFLAGAGGADEAEDLGLAGAGAGAAAGFVAGFTVGFAADFEAGFEAGFAAGFDAGLGAVLEAGFEAGLALGLDGARALAAGFEAGLATALVAAFGAAFADDARLATAADGLAAAFAGAAAGFAFAFFAAAALAGAALALLLLNLVSSSGEPSGRIPVRHGAWSLCLTLESAYPVLPVSHPCGGRSVQDKWTLETPVNEVSRASAFWATRFKAARL